MKPFIVLLLFITACSKTEEVPDRVLVDMNIVSTNTPPPVQQASPFNRISGAWGAICVTGLNDLKPGKLRPGNLKSGRKELIQTDGMAISCARWPST